MRPRLLRWTVSWAAGLCHSHEHSMSSGSSPSWGLLGDRVSSEAGLSRCRAFAYDPGLTGQGCGPGRLGVCVPR